MMLATIIIATTLAVVAAQNKPCPFCKEGSTLLNPEKVVKIPPGYIDIDEATCLQILVVSQSGMLESSVCSILNSDFFTSICQCSDPPPVPTPTTSTKSASPKAARVSTSSPTVVVDFDYPVCSICGAGKRVGNQTKSISTPSGYSLPSATCYQIERLGLIGLMDTTTCNMANQLIAEPQCGCVSKEKVKSTDVPLPKNSTMCHVCGKGFKVGNLTKRLQAPGGFIVGSASCHQVEEIGLLGLVPVAQCSYVKKVVNKTCECISDTTYAPSDSPSDSPSDVPSASPSESPQVVWKKKPVYKPK